MAAGRPFLAWNSRMGIPQDVWAMISTGMLVCFKCNRIRTFAGDEQHRSKEAQGCTAQGKISSKL